MLKTLLKEGSSMFERTKIAMVVAEFLGVATLTSVLLAIGKSGVGYSYFLAGGVALAAGGMALAVGRLSGAHFNPAVTLGLWSSRRIPTVQAVSYIVAQLLGAVAAWRLYVYMAGQALPTSAKAFDWRVFVAEAVGAFVLTFVFASVVYQGYRGLKFAAGVAGAVLLGMLVASIGSNGLANPAISLGVRVWSWSYVAAPLIGGIVGANLYAYLFAEVTPMQEARVSSRSTTARAKRAPAKKTAARRKK
jgi:glycerol uptake facilitator-like aquaporin